MLDPSKGAKGSQEAFGRPRIFNSSLDGGPRLQVNHAVLLKAEVEITYYRHKMLLGVFGSSFLKEANVVS